MHIDEQMQNRNAGLREFTDEAELELQTKTSQQNSIFI